jgi:signal transduction histidine kinase
MARRIAAAILLTVWATLVAGGFATYWVARTVLVGDLDATLTRRAKVVAQAQARGEDPDRAAADVAAAEDRYVISNGLKQSLARASGTGDAGSPPSPQKGWFSRLGDGRLMRTVAVQAPAPDAPGGTISVMYSGRADQVGRVLDRLAVTLAVCGLAAGAAAAAVAVAVARAALRPLNDAADTIGQIDERRLDRRIDADALPPELRPAVERLNDMLARLEHAFAQRKQFLADASHELRTPVAALVTTIEVSLRRRRDAEELTRTLETCLHDARHLKHLVHVLMEHARGEASAAAHAERAETVDAAELLGACADLAAALGVPRGVRVERSLPEAMPFLTQPQRLRSVVTNLLSNAIEYNRPGGLVRLEARPEAGALELTVSDTGRGIAAEHEPHLFEPFYRADESRRGSPAAAAEGGETPHMGLGLFLVDSHLKALGGRCTVESEVGVGTTRRVTVPAAVTPVVTGVTAGAAAPPAPAPRPAGGGTSQNKSPAPTLLESAGKSR